MSIIAGLSAGLFKLRKSPLPSESELLELEKCLLKLYLPTDAVPLVEMLFLGLCFCAYLVRCLLSSVQQISSMKSLQKKNIIIHVRALHATKFPVK